MSEQYVVELVETTTYMYVLESDSPDQAVELAMELLNAGIEHEPPDCDSYVERVCTKDEYDALLASYNG